MVVVSEKFPAVLGKLNRGKGKGKGIYSIHGSIWEIGKSSFGDVVNP